MLAHSPLSFLRTARISKPARLIEKPFAFKNKSAVEAILAKYPEDRKKSAVIPLLHLGQAENGGYITKGVIDAVSEATGSPFGRVHEAATFYTMFRFTPPGKHIIEVCHGLSCYLRGSDDIKKAIEKAAGGTFKEGKSKDGEFSLLEVECLGACANAPVMILDEVYYQDLTVEKVQKIIQNVKKGIDNTKLDAIHTPPAKSAIYK